VITCQADDFTPPEAATASEEAIGEQEPMGGSSKHPSVCVYTFEGHFRDIILIY